MSDWIAEYAEYDSFARDWHADDLDAHGVTLRNARERGLLNEQDTRQLWQLLGRLDDGDLFVHVPEWLAEKKVADTERRTPTTFVGRLARETEEAIRIEEAAPAHRLMRLAHRIHSLERGIETTSADDGRRDELERRLEEKSREFHRRDDVPGLSDEWLPKSQLIDAVRRSE